ncbi:type I-E CRISPR-associated protein Cse1/CasA [Prauserella alba]|uniref:Type I-E CRISPR-associated protein Cse1/CasA n=1 Tax=Prauserella alba TaxID=176898 RepID=A0ABN1VK08_9PSEU|nr:type I-E CRISPR-associated protein Cse1/CasA [Prauserella alba]MCP2182194.1 CRISPR system Cascade subunit CasA [Prauserella alba]
MSSFDVAQQPWVDVTMLDGRPGSFGIRELFASAHKIADIGVSQPIAEAPVRRLLETIAARVTGLDEALPVAEWKARRSAVLATGQFDVDDLDEYLSDWCWDLFDPVRPWMQDPRLAEQAGRVGVSKLDPQRPGGNTPVWFVHTSASHAPSIPSAQAVQLLLYHHAHGNGGTGGTRRVSGYADHHMADAPLRGAITYYPLGQNLFESLIAGMPPPPPDSHHDKATIARADDVGRDGAVDAAPWETELPAERPTILPTVTWPADLLVGRSRHALLLVPDDTGSNVVDCFLTWAYKLPSGTDRPLTARDPHAMMQARKSTTGVTWSLAPARGDRAVWRDLDALLADGETTQRPSVLANAPDELLDTLRIRAVGIVQERGKAVDHARVRSTTPPVLAALPEHDPDAADGVAELTAAAADVEQQVTGELVAAWKRLLGDRPNSPNPWTEVFTARYWSAAEVEFWRRFEQRQFDQPRRAFLAVAWPLLDEIADARRSSPATIGALQTARTKIAAWIVKHEPSDTNTTTEGAA